MNRIFTKIMHLGRLSWRDQALLGNTALLLILTRLIFLCLPFPLIRQRLGVVFRHHGGKIIALDPRAWRILWAVETVSRYLPKMSHCLTKAVVAKMLLNRQGYDVEFQIGVQRSSQGKFEAHAWLESEGRVVMGYLNDLDRFTVFPSMKLDRT